MKKILAIILLVLALSYSPSAWSAMTCVDSGSIIESDGAVEVVTCTFDTTPGTASTTIPDTVMYRSRGRYIYSFSVKPGTTGPTINSDLAITDSRGVTILSAIGNGANVIDNATSTGPFYGDGPTVGTTNHYPKIHAGYAWTITVTNNAVNNSSFILYMER